MKAIMEHDTVLSAIQIKVNGLSVIYAIPNKLKRIIEITDCEDGFLTMQTNYGEEYTDLVELIENSVFDNHFKNKAINIFKKLKAKDIVLKNN